MPKVSVSKHQSSSLGVLLMEKPFLVRLRTPKAAQEDLAFGRCILSGENIIVNGKLKLLLDLGALLKASEPAASL